MNAPGQSKAESPEASGLFPGSRHSLQGSPGVTYHDPDHSVSEQRFITVGMSSPGRVLRIAHTDRDGNIQIISARETTERERKHYEEEN